MKKLLFILFTLLSTSLYSQVFTQTFIDRCTNEVKVVTANFSGGGTATVAFYSRIRTFTYQEFISGELNSWLIDTYSWYNALSPCSTTTQQTQQATQQAQQATQQAQQASQAASSASQSANSATQAATTATTSNVPPPSTNTTAPTGTTQNTTTNTGSTNTSSTNTSSTNTSSTNTSSNNTSGGTTNDNTNNTNTNTDNNNTSNTGSEGTGGGTETGSTETSSSETTSSNEGTDTSTESSSESTSTDESTGDVESSSESTETESTETESTETESTETESTEESTETESTEESTEETSSEESSEESTEESSEESSEEESSEESSEEESSEEESSEESEEESEEESKEEETEEESDEEEKEEESEEESNEEEKEEEEEEQKKFTPIQLKADMMSMQTPLGPYNQVLNIGASRSSIYGDVAYTANIMVWDNLQQVSFMGAISKVNMTKDYKVKNIAATSVGYSNNFGYSTLMISQSLMKPFENGLTVGLGVSAGTTFVSYPIKENFMVSYNVLATKSFKIGNRITYSPALIWTQTPFMSVEGGVDNDWEYPFGIKLENALKGTQIGGMGIISNSFNVQLTKRFSFNVGWTAIKSTNNQIPLINSFMIGSKLPF